MTTMRHLIGIVRNLCEVTSDAAPPTPAEKLYDSYHARCGALPGSAHVRMQLSDRGDTLLEISHIEVETDQRGQGHAARALGLLCDLADELGVTLSLYVATDADEETGKGVYQLVEWYEGFGFEIERHLHMLREPYAIDA